MLRTTLFPDYAYVTLDDPVVFQRFLELVAVRVGQPTARRWMSILENYVVEFLKEKLNRGHLYELFFYRDSNQNEIDLVITASARPQRGKRPLLRDRRACAAPPDQSPPPGLP